MWIQSIAVGYLQYARIVYVFLTRIFIFYLKHESITTLSSKTILQQNKAIERLFLLKEQVIIYK
jgi:uncharacterized membrane protein AbrB (regulator of aidB expression)